MNVKQAGAETNGSDREILITRLIEAPRQRVWQAVTNLDEIERWWGPNGFKNRTTEFSFKPGGIWRHVMIGPDGVEYPNLTRFEEITAPERVVYTNSGGRSGAKGASFRATWTLEAVGDKTELTLRLVFETREARDHVVKEYNAIEGGKQTLGRLNEHVTRKPAFELVLDRVINAPRARVFEAWTNAAQMTEWFAPRPFKLIVRTMDFRPGGGFSMAMRGPDGSEHVFTGTYREIDPPAKLSWTGEFASGPADQISTVVTFEEQGKQTKLHVRQTFHVMTPEIEMATKGARQGWTMTLDQLEQFVS
jgi:uncharacterized protein YndB with AHSA1/START domain